MIVQEVCKSAGAIGFIQLRDVPEATSRGAKVLRIKKTPDSAGILPSEQTMGDGSYPLARPLLLVSRQDPRPEVKKFVEYCIREARKTE